MKQATKTFRTIQHTDDHADIEQLFVVSYPDNDGNIITSQIWAVVFCGHKTGVCDMARTLKGNLTGRAAHGLDEIMDNTPSITDEKRAVIREGIEVNYHNYNAIRWANEVKPVDVDKFLLAMDFIRLQESRSSEGKKLTAREIALPNGKLRSYASYNNTGKAQPLAAEDVDGEILGE